MKFISDFFFFSRSLDPWYQVAFVLTTAVNSAYVLGYSGAIMVPLGWVAGTVGLLLAAAISLNANILLARLHEIGGKRHIRYRDLAGYIYGMFLSIVLSSFNCILCTEFRLLFRFPEFG